MCSLIRLGIVVLIVVFFCHSGAASEPVLDDRNSGRGTLGLLIVTREGIVLAANSRTTYGNHIHDDRAVKVFKLGEHNGCMIAGRVIQAPASANLPGFNLPHEIEEIPHTLGNIKDDPALFMRILEDRLETAISNGFIPIPTTDYFDDDPEVASVIVGGYELLRGTQDSQIPDRYFVEASKIKYLVGPNPGIRNGSSIREFGRTYSTTVRNYHVLEVDGPAPFAIITNGADIVLKDILRDNQHSYFFSSITNRVKEVDLTRLKTNPALKLYIDLRKKQALNSMSLQQAVELAAALIQTNIDLAGDDLGIGGQIDIATITKQQGFRWVDGHDPIVKLQRAPPK